MFLTSEIVKSTISILSAFSFCHFFAQTFTSLLCIISYRVLFVFLRVCTVKPVTIKAYDEIRRRKSDRQCYSGDIRCRRKRYHCRGRCFDQIILHIATAFQHIYRFSAVSFCIKIFTFHLTLLLSECSAPHLPSDSA